MQRLFAALRGLFLTIGIGLLANGNAVAASETSPTVKNIVVGTIPYAQATQAIFAAAAKRQTAATPVRKSATAPFASSSNIPEVVELARALKNNPDLIYEYIYNNVETIPMYGSLKGPMGTILDGSGTAFDQAELMFLLLQQAGYSPNYVFGQVHLTAAQLTTWLGTDTNYNSVNVALGNGGIPATIYSTNNVVTGADIGWAWVQVNLNGTNYVFDPATKVYVRSNGLPNLASAMGYSQASFLSDAQAGSSAGFASLTGLGTGRANLRNDLGTYTTNLVNYIRTNMPAATMTDVIGGIKITHLPINTQLRQTSLPSQVGSPATNATMPAAYRTTIQFSQGSTNSVTLNSSDIYGRRLTGSYGNNQIVIALEGVPELVACVFQCAGITYTITHPYATTAFNSSSNFTAGVSGDLVLIAFSVGEPSRNIYERHRKLLAQNSAALPSNPADESVLGESLAMTETALVAQASRMLALNDQIDGTHTVFTHLFGWLRAQDFDGSHMSFNLFDVNTSTTQRFNRPDSTSTLTPIETGATFTTLDAVSLMETGAFEETMPGMIAASTNSVLDLYAQSSDTLFDINDSTVAGDNASYYNSTIRPQLVPNYSSAELSTIDSLVNSNSRVIAALHGDVIIGDWEGSGNYSFSQNGASVGAIITSPVTYGGTTGRGIILSHLVGDLLSALWNALLNGLGFGGGTQGASKGADPVNLVTGDYNYNHTDISLGSGTFPYQLSFSRSYNSGNALVSGPLGLGWRHNFQITAGDKSQDSAATRPDSGGFEGMGDDGSPISGAPSIVAFFVAQDILNSSGNVLKPMNIAVFRSEISRWMINAMTGNAVTVRGPDSTERFLQLPDGTFAPPLGSGSTLTISGGLYTYKTKTQETFNFDYLGDLATWQSPAGPTVTFTYNFTTLASVSNGMGRTLTLTYGSNGDISSVSDGQGHNVSYAYDASGNLTTVTDPLSHATTFAYSSPGKLQKIFYPSEPSVAFITNSYDTLGRVSSQLDANNNNTSLYVAGTRTEIDDAMSTPHVSYFTPHGRVLVDIDGLGNQSVNTYDGLDRVTSTTLPEGSSFAFTYDSKSNLLSRVSNPKPGSPLQPTSVSFGYDPLYNKLTSFTDENNHQTGYSYDPATGNLLTVTYPDARQETRTYNSSGKVATFAATDGDYFAYTYDNAQDTLSSAEGGNGATKAFLTTTFGYDAVGNLVTIKDPNSHTTTVAFDALRRTTQVTSPTSSVTKYTYDADSNLTQLQKQLNSTSFQTQNFAYTPTFKLKTVTDPSSHVSTYSYDTLDRLSSVLDAQNRTVNYGYDVLSRLTSVTNPGIQAAALKSYTYTPNGKIQSFTDGNGHATGFSYDGFDRLWTRLYPDSSTESFTYDNVGNALTKTTRAGKLSSYAYDTRNRLSQKAPQSQPSIQYTYDGAGRVTSAQDSAGATSSISYDAYGRKASEGNGSTSMTFSYDNAGNRTGLVLPGGTSLNYTYDASNRMTGVAGETYSYDLLSRLTNRTTGGNRAPAGTYTYAINDDLTSLQWANVNKQTISLTYGYNNVHQRTSELVSNSALMLHPSPNGSTVYATSLINEYTSVGGKNYQYDADGNLTSDGTNTYSYDTEDRLIASTAGGHAIAYAYDPLGRRRSKTVDGVTTVYLDDGSKEVAEYSGTGTLQTQYVYGPRDGIPVQAISHTGTSSTTNSILQDALGSAITTVNSSGSSTLNYGPFGETNTLGVALRFTGQRLDPETMLYYYRARTYSPAIGRFMQADPIGYSGGQNIYAYVENDPRNQVDPTGKCFEDACIGEAILLYEGIEAVIAVSETVEVVSTVTEVTATLGETAAETSAFGDVSVSLNGQVLNLSADPLAGTSTGTLAESTPGLGGSPITEFNAYTSEISAGVGLGTTAGGLLTVGTAAALYDTIHFPGESGAAENLWEPLPRNWPFNRRPPGLYNHRK